ncbi:hypothetical protein GCM10010306_082000 [Streptomyces umbrinus]|nr:hypothetical protein GCM10010306_082000 [Streptomyces umbrinus]
MLTAGTVSSHSWTCNADSSRFTASRAWPGVRSAASARRAAYPVTWTARSPVGLTPAPSR